LDKLCIGVIIGTASTDNNFIEGDKNMTNAVSNNRLCHFSQYVSITPKKFPISEPLSGTKGEATAQDRILNEEQINDGVILDNNIKSSAIQAEIYGPANAVFMTKAEYLATNPGPAMYETTFKNLNCQTDETFFTILGGFSSNCKRIEVYYDDSPTEDAPVFYVQAFDSKQNPTAYKIELNKIDPNSMTRAEMVLLTTYMLSDAEPYMAFGLANQMEEDFLSTAYSYGLSSVYADTFDGKPVSYDEMMSQQIDYKTIMGKLADTLSQHPCETARLYAKQLNALFEQIDSGDWSKLGELCKKISMPQEEYNAMMERDEKLWVSYLSGDTKESDDKMFDKFKNFYGSSFKIQSDNRLLSSWDDFFKSRNNSRLSDKTHQDITQSPY
jgi:hypothetical protein